jgi:16S rRNA (uracil1498-N3)-methyltransferase
VSGLRPRFFVDAERFPSPPGASLAPSAALRGSELAAGAGLRGRELTLGAEDSYHALRVLRLREGDKCEVVVGAAVYAASVSQAGQLVRVMLTDRLEGAAAGAVYQAQVGLVQALARPALIEQILEKGTEVGASFFVLVPTANSPRQPAPPAGDRLVRWRRIVLEAAKQSKQVAVPEVELMDSVEQAIRWLNARGAASLVLDPAAVAGLQDTLQPHAAKGARIALWVGPESGWTAADAERFRAAGMEAVRLGRSVLRTETAGAVAVAVARLVMGDW